MYVLPVPALASSTVTPDGNGPQTSNRATVQQLSRVAVSGLPPTAVESLSAAGAALPVGEWL